MATIEIDIEEYLHELTDDQLTDELLLRMEQGKFDQECVTDIQSKIRTSTNSDVPQDVGEIADWLHDNADIPLALYYKLKDYFEKLEK